MSKKSDDKELVSPVEKNEIPEGEPTNDKKKRVFESRYNPIALRDLIFAGNNAFQICQALGIKHKQSLKQHVLKLISEDQTFYDVKGLIQNDARRPRINPKGEIRINLKKLNILGEHFKAGDEFHTIVDDDGRLILTKI